MAARRKTVPSMESCSKRAVKHNGIGVFSRRIAVNAKITAVFASIQQKTLASL